MLSKIKKILYVKLFIRALSTKKGDIEKVHKAHQGLFAKNIPKHLTEKKFNRRELHFVYILYKALCEVTSQRYKQYSKKLLKREFYII